MYIIYANSQFFDVEPTYLYLKTINLRYVLKKEQENLILTGRIEGKRARDRQRSRMLDN